ncbi:MAG: peptidoglycan DD-metalloendopeptidase family protein [Butyrivibrio sp.]
MNRNKRKKLDGEKIFSIVATIAIVAALVVGIITIVRSATSQKNKNFIDLNVEKETESESEDGKNQLADNKKEEPSKDAGTKPAEEIPSKTIENTKPDIPASVTEEEPSVEVNAPVYNFGESDSLLWPVEGEIVLEYNMDNTIYFPTLDQYRCNPAIVISAQKGTEVLSAAPGVVEDIYEDPVIGTTMVVSIGNGYKLVYGQLSELAVGISDNVEAGTVIGKVANPTKYFSVEGSNLYFKLTSDDKPVDPTMFLIGEEE